MKLEGFQYATPLDVNMGYYHIRIIHNTINSCTTIILWGKYCHKSLPVGVAKYWDIFKQNMNDSFNKFEFIHAYIDEILILIKRYWTDHVQKLEITPNKLKEKWLKCNFEKWLFGQTEMEYLGFWVTRDGVRNLNRKI